MNSSHVSLARICFPLKIDSINAINSIDIPLDPEILLHSTQGRHNSHDAKAGARGCGIRSVLGCRRSKFAGIAP